MTASDLDELVRRIGDELLAQLGVEGAQAPVRPACGCEAGLNGASASLRVNGHGAEGESPVVCPDWRPPKEGIAGLIDHTLLDPAASESGIVRLCGEARRYGFRTVCVQPTWVARAVRELQGAKTGVTAVIGFPHGAAVTPVKRYEAEQALKLGACELDMAANIGALKSGKLDLAASDIRCVAETAHSAGAALKVILEMGLLSEEEKVTGCVLARIAGADFVKTSTGFAGSADPRDVALMHRVVGGEMGVKAAGGIRTYERFTAMMKAGTTRIGASASVELLQQAAAAA